MSKRIVVLLGSPNKKSRSSALAYEVVRHIENANAEFISLEDIDARALLQADFYHDQIKELTSKVLAADAVILAAPVYKASITAGLKAFIDVLPENSLKGKTILSLASGGSIAHLLAIDHALHPIITSLKAERFIPTVFATDADIEKRDTGEYHIESLDLRTRLKQAARALTQSISAGLDAASNTQTFTIRLATV